MDWEGSLWVRALVGITQGETETSLSEDRKENLSRFIFSVGMSSCLVGAPCSVISARVGCKVKICVMDKVDVSGCGGSSECRCINRGAKEQKRQA